MTEGKAAQQNISRTQCRTNDMPNALDRIRQVANRNKEEQFTALLHHITIERLSTAFYGIKKNAAAGVDGVTWKRYEEELEENLQDLYSRIHRGAYRARPSRRRYIPKPDGRQRPLGISALEDKIVQRAVAEVLNAIYEADLGFKILRKRSQRTRMTWERMVRIVDRWLPPARILYPWPEQRFAVMTQGRSRMR